MSTPHAASRRTLLAAGGLGATGLFAAGPAFAAATGTEAAPLAFTSPAHPTDGTTWWLRLPGIEGEAYARGHEGEIVLRALDWKVSGVPAKGSRAGQAKSRDVSLAFDTSVASPSILKACVGGAQFATARISGRAAEQGNDHVWWDFTGVQFSSYDVAFTEGAPLDVVTFAFDTVAMSYRQLDPKGTLLPAVTVTWDSRTGVVS